MFMMIFAIVIMIIANVMLRVSQGLTTLQLFVKKMRE